MTTPLTPPSPSPPSTSTSTSPLRQTLAFLLVGLAWGLTTPFIRRAALTFQSRPRPHSSSTLDPIRRTLYGWILRAADLARCPAYWVPLVVNLSGSVWFFMLVGGSELSLTVPITNSLAFLFTVVGEWWVEGKVISRDTWIGMAFVLGGIALCVQSKNPAF